jgi:hypothetical protein
VNGQLKVEEPRYSEIARREEDAWEPDWTIERFYAVLKCGVSECGELVVMSGDTEVVEEIDEELRQNFISYLRPRGMFPAPPVIKIPKNCPEDVVRELKQSFQALWSDRSACANRLRASLERLLDDKRIKKYERTGPRKPLALAKRIGLFRKREQEALTRKLKGQKPEVIEYELKKDQRVVRIFDALRLLGNLGTHGEIDRVSVLAAYQMYEVALQEIYGDTENVDRMVTRAIASRGKRVN